MKKTNKLISILLVVAMLLSMAPIAVFTASAASPSYNGTPVTPLKINESNYNMLGLTQENWSDYSGYYAIRNASELYGFAALVNGGNRSVNGVLLQDIVVNTSVSASGAPYSWTPIGATEETAFLGTFDGAGHSISGIYYKNADATYVGLFGCMGEYGKSSGATVKNLTLKNSYFSGKNYVGGFVGCFFGYNVKVTHCKTDSDVSVVANQIYTVDKDFFYVGGIVGGFGGAMLNQTCYVSHCVNLASVIGNVIDIPADYILETQDCDRYIGSIAGSWNSGYNAGVRVTVDGCYSLDNCVKVTDGDEVFYRNYVCGGPYENLEGSGTVSWADYRGSTVLSSATAAHTCVAVATPEIKANCAYGGHSAYSYCLICGTVTSGTKTLTESNDTHFYKGATCTANGVCQLCGDANGPKNPDNHISWIPANCMAPATCEFCFLTKGEKNPDNHTDADKFTYTVNENDESKHDAFYEQCKVFSHTEGHSYDAQGKCTKCTYECAHPAFTDGVCDTCAYKCAHSHLENNKCTACGLEGSIKYINRVWNSTTKQVEETVEIAPVSITEVTAETAELTDGWYIVNGTVNNKKYMITVSGTVHLILADGASLTTGACTVNEGNSLYIYAQSTGADMGLWKLTSPLDDAMLGGAEKTAAGKIVINGGFIQASVSDRSRYGAAIGSGYNGTGGEIIINGGFVKASSYDGAAIGSGYGGTPVNISVNGGTVYASAQYGAGIGGDRSVDAGNVTINGGNIYATSYRGEKVGAGYEGKNFTVTDGNGNDVTLSTITLSGAAADTPVTKVEGITYGLTDVKTYNTDKLYFYLPADAVITSITAGGNEYICNSNLTYYTSHDWSNLDGICANGCGLECPHENETGDTCSVCGSHICRWSYSASGDTITAVCENTDGNCPDSEGTLTILAPADLYVDGTAKEATVENNLVDTSVAVSDITYSTADGSAPKTAGTYTASVTVEGATATVEFELIKRSAAAENFVYTAPENLVYDGTAKYATVEASPEITGLGEITVTYYKDGEAVEPIDAGSYTVKVSTADSDKYYAVNDVELASFTIAAKDISDGFIILGEALTYNGTELTQTVEKVLTTNNLEATFDISGNKATNVGVYLLTVTGTGNFTGEAKIAYEIAVDASKVEGLTIENVKSSDKENIEYVYNQLENAVKDLADEEKITEWNTLQAYCGAMRQRIYSVESQIESFKNELAKYDINTVTSDDNDDLVNLFDSVYSFTVEYNDNLTDDEKDKCAEISAAIADLTRRIGAVGEEITRITNAVNGYDKATVKSSDKADLEQLLADINALTTGKNITDSERADLLALAEAVNGLLAVINDTADEINRIVNAVNAYDINTVTGNDVQDLLGLIDDANALLETDNLTVEETETLNKAIKDTQSLISRYDRVSAQIGDIKDRLNNYDEATVKSSDKADIEQLIADIKDLTDGHNLTADEREYLVNADATCDKLLAKIAETKSEYDRVIAAANGYDEATVTSADKDALVQLNDDIYALALTDNVTAEEKENLQAAHDKVLGLIDKLTGISDEIKRIIEAVDKYVFESVKSSDKADIQQLIADIKALLDTQNITADERALLEGADETCDKFIAKIDETVAEINRINNATNAYDEATVTSADKADIEKLLADIKALTDGDNITNAEREQLNGNETTLNTLLERINATADEIARIETAVNGYGEESVKSTDKSDLEKLKADIKALTDATNITEDERTALEALEEKADALIKKIDDTAKEIERIENAVNGYDEETVKSSDIPALGKLIDDIKALTDSDNLTEDEKAALEEADKAIDELVEKLTEVAEEIKRVDEAVKSYDEETVKSTDSDELSQLKEDVQALIDSGNVTENEKTALGEMIEKVDALEEKIEEIETQLEEIKDIENNFNPENVSSDDKAAIEDKIAEIEAVNPDNLTDEQKAEYEEIKAGFEALLEEIAAAEKDVADIGVELEMFDEERVTKFWEDDIEALKTKIDELLADENMGEAEKAKLTEYKAQCDNLIEIINTPVKYFSLRFFYFIWDCLTWKYNGILWIFSKIFAC